MSDEVLVRVEGVSKKFCWSLKKSLWYGVCDIASELNPFGRNTGQSTAYNSLTTEDTESTTEQRGRCEMEQSQIGPKGEGAGATESKGAAGWNQQADSGEFLKGHSQAGLQMDSEKLASIRAANASSGSAENSSSAKISEICGQKNSIAPEGAGLRPGKFWAVKDVSFELRRGECLGLIGHNGAGNQAAGQPLGPRQPGLHGRLPQGSPKGETSGNERVNIAAGSPQGEMSGSERINTTLLKMLNGLIKPDAGSITMRGRVGALIALGAGFNPILTGREPEVWEA